MAASGSSDGDSNFDADEEDEEIDEGLAFTADDEAKYGNWFEKDDDDEDLSGDEDEGPEEWDDEEAEEAPPARAAGAAAALIDDADTWLGATSDGDATSDGNEEDGGDQGGDEDDENDPAHAAMLDAVLARKRKARQHLEPIGEAIAEGEANVGAASDAGGALNVAELMDAADLDKVERKRLARVARGTEALQAALPKTIRQRQERKAAYEVSRKQASSWTPLVKANREAATLRLKSDTEVPKVTTAAGLASRHEPVSSFENEVAALLKAAGHASTQAVLETEKELSAQKMTPEEATRRQEAMAKNNALLFYQEQKAKRVKKIKSKAYHRHLKKQGEKARALLGNHTLDDPDAAMAQAEEDEFRRAQERLTLKHRNTSRWARRALKRGLSLATDDQRDAIHEQLRVGRELKAKAASARTSSDSDASSEAPSGEDDGQDASASELTNREKLALAEAIRTGAADSVEQALPAKGLFAMPFMRRALRKQGADVAETAQAMLDSDLVATEATDAVGVTELGPARQAFGGPNAAAQNARTATHDSASESGSSGEDEDEDDARGRRREAHATEARAAAADAAEARRRGGGESTQRRGASGTNTLDARAQASRGDGDVAASLPSVVLHARSQRGTASAVVTAAPSQQQTAQPQRSTGALPDAAPQMAQAREAASAPGTPARGLPRSVAADEAENAAASGFVGVDSAAAMAAAFAGDDVVADFEAEKADAVKESTEGIEDPQALPGWGTWANTKREPRWLVEKKAKAEAERARRLAGRADAKLKGVVISEKWDKKWQKYTTPNLPFPYSQKEVYEKSMRVPLGRDVNTEAAFREMTRPEVIKQTGQIIRPLQMSNATLEASSAKKRRGDAVVVVAGGKVKASRKH